MSRNVEIFCDVCYDLVEQEKGAVSNKNPSHLPQPGAPDEMTHITIEGPNDDAMDICRDCVGNGLMEEIEDRFQRVPTGG